MPKLTPDEFVEKHARRTKAAVPDMQAGIERVTVAPTQQAASKQDKMLANLTASVQSGKWARGLNRVSLEEWKTKAIQKGIPRVAAGIDGAYAKTKAFAEELLPYQEKLQSDINKMADNTIEDSIARMGAWARGMNKFRRTR